MAAEGISNQENMNVQVSSEESVATTKHKRGANKAYIKKPIGDAKHLLQNKESFNKFDMNSLKVIIEEKLHLIKCFDDRVIEFIDDEEDMLHEIEASGEFWRYVNSILF